MAISLKPSTTTLVKLDVLPVAFQVNAAQIADWLAHVDSADLGLPSGRIVPSSARFPFSYPASISLAA
jgi:hypothetical protein